MMTNPDQSRYFVGRPTAPGGDPEDPAGSPPDYYRVTRDRTYLWVRASGEWQLSILPLWPDVLDELLSSGATVREALDPADLPVGQPANEFALALAGTTLEQSEPEPEPRPDTPADPAGCADCGSVDCLHARDARVNCPTKWGTPADPDHARVMGQIEDLIDRFAVDGPVTAGFTPALVAVALYEEVFAPLLAGVRGEPHTPTEPDSVIDGVAFWESLLADVYADGTGREKTVRIDNLCPGHVHPAFARRLAERLIAAADWAEGAEGGGRR